MSVASSSPSPTFFDLRNATLTLIAVVVKTTDLELLSQALEERFGPTPALFDHDPVVIDLAPVAGAAAAIDFAALTALLRARRMVPVGVENGSPEQMEAALVAGLAHASTFAPPPRPEPAEPAPKRAPAAAAKAKPALAPSPTLVIDRPLRSGQQVYARNADLVVMAAVNFGAEVIADGHIHVYAPLRGRAIAGARGNIAARIFSTCMEPQLVSIAGTYRAIDTPLPADVLGKPAQVRLDGDALIVEALAN